MSAPWLAFLEDTTWVLIILCVVVLVLFISMMAKTYKIPKAGTWICRDGVGGRRISNVGIFCVDILHRYEVLDMKLITVPVDIENLRFANGIIETQSVNFFVRVMPDKENVLQQLELYGAQGISDPANITNQFESDLRRAVTDACAEFTLEGLSSSPDSIAMNIQDRLAGKLPGYELHQVRLISLPTQTLEHDLSNQGE